uniref:Endonuclease/exonuclease/phosphatase domain-containing protein n=1 Tax=Astyanax mexicanus TaxID=7994 RepID=A0A3B1JKT5_ASTMX
MDQYNKRRSEMVLKSETPGLEGTDHITREERGRFSSSEGIYDVDGTNPSGLPPADVAPSKRKRLRFSKTPHNIGTWNVRGMNIGKLEIIKQEMKRLYIDLLGISEFHWTGNGYFKSDEYTVFYSGNDTIKRNGVAIIATKVVSKAAYSFNVVSDQIISIRIAGSPRSITFLQAYAPTTDAAEKDIKGFYTKLQETIDQTPARDIIFVMGDFNAKVGSGEELPTVGKFGLGVRNDAGDRLIQCCIENRLSVMNTWFKQPKRRLYTWTAPNGIHRNQIDYFLCQRCWKSSILSKKTYPGADCGSDHQLMVAKIKIRFSTIKRPQALRRFDTDNIPAQYAMEVKNRFETFNDYNKEPDALWAEIKSIVGKTAEEIIPFKKSKKRSKWLTDEAFKIAEHRRMAKASRNSEDFRLLNAALQRRARQDKEAYWNNQCEELEKANRHGHTRTLFTHVKQARTSFM